MFSNYALKVANSYALSSYALRVAISYASRSLCIEGGYRRLLRLYVEELNSMINGNVTSILDKRIGRS